jgi:serine protease Do/serine protease DegQ
MKSFVAAALASFIALSPTALSAAATKDGAPNAPLAKPNVVFDRSPVNEAKGPIVASYADVVEPVQRAVVSVYSTKFVHERLSVNPLFRPFLGDQVPERSSKEQGLGSGVIVSANGYILTNNHVVEGADELNVTLPDGRDFKGRIVGTDPKTDVAVVKIDVENLPTVALADSDKLRVGDIVFAVGNPLGIGQTVTMGIVSAKGRNNLGLIEGGYEDFIQTDAAINMGNSGGALVDAKGRLIGINSAIVSNTRGNIGIGLAIPSNLAASIMNSLVETGSITRGYLGISVEPVSAELAETLGIKKETKAVVVTQVTAGSPAEKAGLRRSDVILSIDDKPVTSVQDLRLLVAKIAPDTEVGVKMVREGREKTLTAKIGRLNEAAQINEFLPGVDVSPLTDEIRRRHGIPNQLEGLIITRVDARSPYADRFASNMVILEINRQPVPDIEAAKSLLLNGRNLLLVYNRGTLRYLVVTKDTR